MKHIRRREGLGKQGDDIQGNSRSWYMWNIFIYATLPTETSLWHNMVRWRCLKLLTTELLTCVCMLKFSSSTVHVTSVNVEVKKFIPNKSVSTTSKIFEGFSLAQCIKKCNDEAKKSRCNIAGYNTASRRCQMSMDERQDVLDVADTTSGVVYIKGTVELVISTHTLLCVHVLHKPLS